MPFSPVRMRLAISAALAAGPMAALPCARAQETPRDQILDRLAPDGRTFAGVRLPLDPIEGPISFQAAKVTTWNEAANGIETIRLLLEGSVVARLGLYTLTAERANVWLEKRPAEETDRPTYQLFVYFDRVSTPDADYTLGVWADRLPVEGVIRPEQGVLLAYDLLEQGRPDDAFVDEGERTLAAYLRSLLSPGSFVAGQGPTQYQPDEPTQPTIGPHP
ncbi:MAG: hypothetical protein IID31_12995, partial [Planctomycetes bacterium]|nr:hypothetical protein [Planctomycetota bacterium]